MNLINLKIIIITSFFILKTWVLCHHMVLRGSYDKFLGLPSFCAERFFLLRITRYHLLHETKKVR